MAEKVSVSVPVEVSVRLTETLIEDALRKSETFWVKIKPRLDLAKFLETQMKDPKEFYLWFYSAENLTLDEVFKKIKEMIK